MGLKRIAELEMDQKVLKKKLKETRNKKVNVLQMIINILISLSYKGLSCLNT